MGKREVPETPFFYTLKKPISVETTGKDAGEIKQVKVKHQPVLKDLRKIYKHSDRFDRLACALERLTDLPAGAIEELNFQDVDGLGDAISPFFVTEEDSEEGDNSSPDAPSA